MRSAPLLPIVLLLLTTPLSALTLHPHVSFSSLLKRAASSTIASDGGYWLKHILFVASDSESAERVALQKKCTNQPCDQIHTYCPHSALGCRCIATPSAKDSGDKTKGVIWHGSCGDPTQTLKTQQQQQQQQQGGSGDAGRQPGGGTAGIRPVDDEDDDDYWDQGGFGPSGMYWELPCVCNATCVDAYCCESATGFINKKGGEKCQGQLQETY